MTGEYAFARHDLSHIPAHCFPSDDFLRSLSHYWRTCVPTYLALVSTVLGSCSIAAWLCAQLPQIYKNYKIRSTAGLSIGFLAIWCLGDTANLVGALLTGQATWQVIVAAYYTLVDLALVGQYIWYESLGHGRKKRKIIATRGISSTPGRRDGTGEREPLLASQGSSYSNGTITAQNGNSHQGNLNGSAPVFKFPALLESGASEKHAKHPPAQKSIVRTARPTSRLAPSSTSVLLVACVCIAVGRASPIQHSSEATVTFFAAETHQQQAAELAGRLISWMSTVLYLVSRLPQIIKNHRRKSTAGLSPTLFMAAFFGNLFYSSSLLTNPLAWASYGPFGHRGWAGPQGSSQEEWVLSATPFFLGAAGVLILDATVGVQFLKYGDGRKQKFTPRIPITTTTPAEGTDGVQEATPVPSTRYLAVPPGGVHAAEQQPQEFEAGSWRRVSGYMRGWVPSFSPGSWQRGSYMAAASRAPRDGRDVIIGRADEVNSSRDRSPSPLRSNSSSGAAPVGKTVNGLRAEVEAWESRNGTRQGSVADNSERAGRDDASELEQLLQDDDDDKDDDSVGGGDRTRHQR